MNPLIPVDAPMTEDVSVAHAKMGLLIVAGGQGTRLGFAGPKGCYPMKGKSLFQRIIEHIPLEHKSAPISIMTSPLNHEATVSFFKENRYFGVPKDQITFFQQGMLPFLDDTGNPIEESPGTLALGPNGNGLTLSSFVKAGIWQKWQLAGIDAVHFIQVDNLLARPFTLTPHGEVNVLCIKREDPKEKLGIIAKQNNQVVVIEYTEIEDPELKFPLGNISQFTFSMPFIQKASQVDLPIHLSHKKALSLGKEVMAWKQETFIFDLLPYATTVYLTCLPRRLCFAPLKSAEDLPYLESILKP